MSILTTSSTIHSDFSGNPSQGCYTPEVGRASQCYPLVGYHGPVSLQKKKNSQGPVKTFTFSSILLRVAVDRIFLSALYKVSGRKFFKGPIGFVGFCKGVIVTSPMEIGKICVSKQLLMIPA